METKLATLIGEHRTRINKREYKLCLIAFLGHSPSDIEMEILFQNNVTIPLADVKKVITRHARQNNDLEYEAMEIFRLFDCENKGYINLKDVHRTWKAVSPYLSWTHLSECFSDVSVDNKMYYDLFKTMYVGM